MIHFLMVYRELWGFLFVLGALLLNWPILGIFDLSMPYYLFFVWGVFIVAVGLVTALSRKTKTG